MEFDMTDLGIVAMALAELEGTHSDGPDGSAEIAMRAGVLHKRVLTHIKMLSATKVDIIAQAMGYKKGLY